MTSKARSLYLGVDVGTQGVKALLVDGDCGDVIARSSEPLTLIEGLPAGHMEQHPQDWIDAVVSATKCVLSQADVANVAGIGVSGQQHGCVVLDEHDRVIRPAKLWCDTSTATEASDLSARIGRSVPTGFTASKLTWLKKREPQNWLRVRRVLLPHDFVNFWLTGVASMECGDASGTGWFDPVRRAFDRAAMDAIDPQLASFMPPLLSAGEIAGRLSGHAASLLGLPAGIPVSAGGGDNMMSAIGSGATKSGVVVVSLGTSGTIFCRNDEAVVDSEELIAPFCSSDGGYLPLLCVMNLTGVTEEVKSLSGLDHDALTSAAASVPAGCDGLLWLPFLMGERVPDLPNATGTLLGIRPGLLRPGHLYRAALEGTSWNLGLGFQRLRDLKVPIHEVRLTGGAAKNPLWRQILANVFGVPIRVLAETESAAFGAALQACWSVRRLDNPELTCHDCAAPFVHTGEATPPNDEAPRYAELLQRYHAEVERLHNI